MNRKLYWGLGVLMLLIIGATVFVYVKDQAEIRELEKQLAALKAQETQQVADTALPPAPAGYKWVQHGDHHHLEPIDAPDTWQGEPHPPVVDKGQQQSEVVRPNFSVDGEVEITKLPKLPTDIDPDDIPPFYETWESGKRYYYNRPLTPEERAKYFDLKAKFKNEPFNPALTKKLAINAVRREKREAGALRPIYEAFTSGRITSEEARLLIDEFNERTR